MRIRWKMLSIAIVALLLIRIIVGAVLYLRTTKEESKPKQTVRKLKERDENGEPIARQDFFTTPVFRIEYYLDGEFTAKGWADTTEDLAETIVTMAMRYSKRRIRYAVDPETGLSDLTKPIFEPKATLRIWDNVLQVWVDANGTPSSVEDGLYPVEITVHVGSINK